jgi:uncharacterized protein (TIGR04222 family)
MNPLDWTAGPFLGLYIAVAVAAWAFALFLRLRIGKIAGKAPSFTLAELAYLAGGDQRVGDAAIVGLLTAKAATLSKDGRTVDLDGEKIRTSPDLAPFAGLGLAGVMKRKAFQRQLRPAVEAIRVKLERLGLCLDFSQLMAYRLKVITLFALPLLLGAAKVQVGLERHKPVGILGMLLIVTAIIALVHLFSPRLTRAGRAALAAEKTRNARAARAPLENELLLAVALTGLVVLSGTPYGALYAASKASGGDGGGDGGGGCGGCGGCGLKATLSSRAA